MSKDWYYVVEGNSVGPVGHEEFQSLLKTGTIRSDTLVWQDGMEDWLPYGRASGAAAEMPPQKPAQHGEDPARADANTFLGALKDGFARYVDFKTRSNRPQF